MAITYKAVRWTQRLSYETGPRTKSFTSAAKLYEKWRADLNTKRTGIRRYEFGSSEIIVSTDGHKQ